MQKHILAADDEPNIRRLVEVNLNRAGYRVTLASDGLDALEKFGVERPDMVVLDWMMPRMDGYTVLRRLKSNPATADVPVLMLTAKAQDHDIFEGWRAGVDSYLTKPFNPAELLVWVRRVLDLTEVPDGGGRIAL